MKKEVPMTSKKTSFAQAIENALAQAMSQDERIVIFGEDVELIRLNLFTRFGKERVFNTPISEGAFLGAAVTAAMGGLRPVVEIMLIDFIAVAMDAVLNHAAKIESFSGGLWQVPLVIRASCGGGYGDGGQHEQTLWGMLAHIPGISVVVPSTPAEAGSLILTAIETDHPVIFLEHKLLADYWLDYMGGSSRESVTFDVPEDGAFGEVPKTLNSIPLGQAVIKREGKDITIVSVGVGVHRAIQTADILEKENIFCEVIDLRTITPLDKETICTSVRKTNRLLVVDEDYQRFGLSGELAAVIMEADIQAKYGRVCTKTTIPFAHELEKQVLPNVERIITEVKLLMNN
jgi:pyruvate dehydrogenase E1 component beta subunit